MTITLTHVPVTLQTTGARRPWPAATNLDAVSRLLDTRAERVASMTVQVWTGYGPTTFTLGSDPAAVRRAACFCLVLASADPAGHVFWHDEAGPARSWRVADITGVTVTVAVTR